ncbi:NADH dehydrogenase subunit G [Magnetococcus marinus MC-1]|uniref:NADH-quinone oxidoreductase n=1 Tax=Magnetococcus marinus (strain ATCC BAA-1437 / JCM 17883 / MC-1) TaxID=156889 RepID=A0LDS1_MAGMM|nr:NADH-quinone oxidoreductase subunit NuoG [Magnetococcus marinus]ABK46114.1 NADH dehydrogenase subunit G [Magnetococcus marinus MC-1]
MPTLIIDGKEISVQPGTTIMEAAKKLGVYIPHFCYHPKLSVAGNCRMCLVEVVKMPRPVVACAMPVGDGMEVKTHSDMVMAARQGVMEFLLINHPLDCPVCDQGGACDLQDLAMKYGPDRSRYIEIKRQPNNLDLGPIIETEMDRCIHCTRCIRFSTEIAGVEEMGATGRGDHMLVGTYVSKALSSELVGNLAQVCPVGALNDKPFHFKARSWEMSSGDGICTHCSVGCQVRVDHLDGEVKRVVARECDEINETWLCDRGRFSYDGLSVGRLTQPTIRGEEGVQEVSWAEAMTRAAELIKAGEGDAVAGIASEEQTVAEELYAFQDFMRNVVGSPHLDHRIRQRDFSGDAVALTRADLMMNTSLEALEEADGILLVGSNSRYDVPLLNLRLRKAARKGAKVMAINPCEKDLALPGLHTLVTLPGEEPGVLSQILAALKGKGAGEAAQVAAMLKAAEKPVILLGDFAINHPAAETLRRTVVAILEKLGKLDDSWNGYNRVSARAAAVTAQDMGVVPHRGAGYAIVGKRGKNAHEILQGAAEGSIKVLFVLGADLEREAADPKLARAALEKADVIYLGAFSNSTSEAATVVLPGLTPWEKSSTVTNAEGRAQRMEAMVPAPGEAKEDWRVLRKLSDWFSTPLSYTTTESLRQALENTDLRYKEERLVCEDLTPACDHKPVTTGLAVTEWLAPPSAKGLRLSLELPFYHSDAMVRGAKVMQALNGGNRLRIHPVDAAKAKVVEGGMVRLIRGDHTVELQASIDAGVPVGSVVAFANFGHQAVHRLTDWEHAYPDVSIAAI